MQRTIRPTSRAVSSVIQSATRIPLRQGSPFIRSRAFGTPLQRTAARWYSDATETKKEETPAEGEKVPAGGEASAAQEQDQAASEATSEDPKQKELEAAKKEIVELKVGQLSMCIVLS
jgi:sRNA-binding protein